MDLFLYNAHARTNKVERQGAKPSVNLLTYRTRIVLLPNRTSRYRLTLVLIQIPVFQLVINKKINEGINVLHN
jgi:hypothetical protein